MNNYDPKKVRDYISYVERVNQKRGELINETINLENIIESFIVSHFCSDDNKKPALLWLIIRDLTFDKKITIFNELVKSNYKTLSDQYPKMFSHFKEIRVMRNNLAHRLLHRSLEAANENIKSNTINFIDKHSNDKLPISEKKIQSIINLTKYYVIAFMMLGRSSPT